MQCKAESLYHLGICVSVSAQLPDADHICCHFNKAFQVINYVDHKILVALYFPSEGVTHILLKHMVLYGSTQYKT